MEQIPSWGHLLLDAVIGLLLWFIKREIAEIKETQKLFQSHEVEDAGNHANHEARIAALESDRMNLTPPRGYTLGPTNKR